MTKLSLFPILSSMNASDEAPSHSDSQDGELLQRLNQILENLENFQPKDFPEIMDVETASKFIGLNRKSLMKMVKEKKIPMIRANGRRLFRKSRVLEALDRLST